MQSLPARMVAPRRRPEDRALADGDGDGGVLRIDLHLDGPRGDAEQRGADGVAFEDDVVFLEHLDGAVQQEFAHLQRRQALEDLDIAAQEFNPLRHAFPDGKIHQPGFQQGFVGGLEIDIAGDELDHVIALVHAMLDQGIAGQGADGIDAGHGGFKLRAQLGKGVARLAAELDAALQLGAAFVIKVGGIRRGAHRFHKAARRCRTHAGDDAVAGQAAFAFGRLDGDPAVLDLGRAGFGEDGNAPGLLRLHQHFHIGRLGLGEILGAVDHGDDVALLGVLGQAAGIFDPGIAAADNENMLVEIFARIVQLVLHMRQPGAVAAHQIGIALGADRHDHGLGLDHIAAGERDGEIAPGAGDRFDVRLVADIGLGCFGLLVPVFQDGFALAGIEAAIGAQGEADGRRHHMLALLVTIDGVGEVVGFFQQHMAEAACGGAVGGAHPRRPRADNGYLKTIRHDCPHPIRKACQSPGLLIFHSPAWYARVVGGV